jgi:LacI family transcriptional regulator, repressor for deo operon, udp, cdd, tsx, nupC, and nupG
MNRLPPSAKARIADVARLAGVSVATVSRALSDPGIVTEETRARVVEAVRATGYTPNAAARNLRVRRSMMALVVVPDISNTFFAEILRGVDAALSNAGYGLIIGNLDNAPEKEARYVELAQSGQVDGVILLCGHVLSGGRRRLEDARLPMVAACEIIPGAPFPQVEINNAEAAQLAVRHLIDLGHRRIAYLSGPETNILNTVRQSGYRTALDAAGIALATSWELNGNFSFHSGSRAADAVLAMPKKERPTALFAANDEMAIGFLKRLSGTGLRVPDDFSIVGFDAIDYADYVAPTLTTVRQPRKDIGLKAAELLIDIMSGNGDRLPPRTILTADLDIRESTGPVPAI